MSDTQLLKTMYDKLIEGSEEARYSAVVELSAIKSAGTVPLLMKAVGDQSYRVREQALTRICSFSPDVIFPRLEDFLRNNENANLRTAALEAFPRYGREATPYLLNLVTDYDEEVRMFSATILGDIKDPEAVESLLEAMQDPDENVRHASIESLGKIGDARAVPRLIDCLKQDFWIQFPAIVALGNIGDPSVTIHLVEYLDDEMLRQPVIEALGKIGDVSAVPMLAERLTMNDPEVRNDIIASLVNIQQTVKTDGTCLPSIRTALESNELIEHLLTSLDDPDPEIKKNAVIALGWLKQDRAVEKLVELLVDYELEEYVTGALLSIGENALPELIKGLGNDDPKILTSIIRCLDWIGQSEGIKACLPHIESESLEVRNQAVMAMAGVLKDEEVEDALLGLLSKSESEFRNVLVEVMGRSTSGRMLEKLLGMLETEDDSIRVTVVMIVGRMKNPEACKSLEKLLDEKSDELRAHAYKGLFAIRSDQLPKETLLRGLRDPSPVVRKAMARCVETSTDDEVMKMILYMVKDPDQEVRFAALESLGKIGRVSCIDHLVDNFFAADKKARMAIIRAMGNIYDKRSAQFLAELLKDSDPEIKRTALDSLRKIKERSSMPAIIVALDDPEWSVRASAIRALAGIGDRKCTQHLIERLEDKEDIVKKEAVLALGQLGQRSAANFILPLVYNENLQLEVLSAIEKLGIPDLEFFSDFFARSNTKLKCQLVDLLSRLQDPNTVNFLIKALANEFFTVRCRAARALAELESKRAVPALIKAQKNDPSEEVRREAALALKKLESQK